MALKNSYRNIQMKNDLRDELIAKLRLGYYACRSALKHESDMQKENYDIYLFQNREGYYAYPPVESLEKIGTGTWTNHGKPFAFTDLNGVAYTAPNATSYISLNDEVLLALELDKKQYG